jgi:hypothetical protein
MTEPRPNDGEERAPTEVPYDEIAVPEPDTSLNKDTGHFEETYEGVDLNAYQRRAVLLRRVLEAGHPRALDATQYELAGEFDVSQSTISDDFQILKEWMGENLTRGCFGIMDMVYRSSISHLMDDGEYRDAVRSVSDWMETLADIGAIERAPDRVDLDVSRDGLESEAYEILPDTDDDTEGEP